MSLLRDQLPRRVLSPRGRVPRQRVPIPIALGYFGDLRRMLEFARDLVRVRVLPVLRELSAEREDAGDVRTDASRDPAGRINRLMDRVSAAFFRRWDHKRTAALARKYAEATSEYHRAQLAAQIRARLGIDPLIDNKGLAAAIKAATAENVALIKTVPQAFFDQIERRMVEGMRAGRRHEEIAGEIEERFGVARSRAKLIARDQTLKLYGELNATRQKGLGITRYVWRSVNDERVRDAHGEFDGNTYSWDDPPGDGSAEEGTHPGTAINCRCYADPVIEDVLPGADDR